MLSIHRSSLLSAHRSRALSAYRSRALSPHRSRAPSPHRSRALLAHRSSCSRALLAHRPSCYGHCASGPQRPNRGYRSRLTSALSPQIYLNRFGDGEGECASVDWAPGAGGSVHHITEFVAMLVRPCGLTGRDSRFLRSTASGPYRFALRLSFPIAPHREASNELPNSCNQRINASQAPPGTARYGDQSYGFFFVCTWACRRALCAEPTRRPV